MTEPATLALRPLRAPDRAVAIAQLATWMMHWSQTMDFDNADFRDAHRLAEQYVAQPSIETLRAKIGELAWMPYPENGHALYDVLIIGRVQRFYDDAPAYAEALGRRIGAVTTDSAARQRVIDEIVRGLANG